jgi:hypothetical protein
MIALAGDVDGHRVLDAGCGSGPLFAALRAQGAVVTEPVAARRCSLETPKVALAAEVEMDDENIDMPHERFVRLRSSAGPIGLVGASGVIGSAVQPFGVEVPDRLKVPRGLHPARHLACVDAAADLGLATNTRTYRESSARHPQLPMSGRVETSDSRT